MLENFGNRSTTPMGLFNFQGERGRGFLESLQTMAPEQQVKEINNWIDGIAKGARKAYLQDGKVVIPRPILIKGMF